MPLDVRDLLVTTWEQRQKSATNNIAKRNKLWRMLKEANRIKTTTGNPIRKELLWKENPSFKYYSGFETLSTDHEESIGYAEFDLKQAAVCVSISGFEESVNSGSARQIDLLATRMEGAESTMMNQVGIGGVYSAGNAFGGKQIGGLQLLVSNTPSIGVVGTIDRAPAANAFWRNQVLSATTNLGAPKSVGNYITGVSRLIRAISVEDTGKKIIVADNDDYELYAQSQRAIQRHIREDGIYGALGGALDFEGHPFVYDGGFGGGCPANTTYILSPEHLFVEHVEGRLFSPLKKREAQNQDASMVFMVAYLNMTMNCAYKQAVFIA